MRELGISIVIIENGNTDIESLLENYFETNAFNFNPVELIIIDNDGTDKTLENISRYSSRAFIRYIKQEQYCNFYSSLKVAIKLVQHPYVLLLTNTNTYMEKAVNLAIKKMSKLSIGIVGLKADNTQGHFAYDKTKSLAVSLYGYVCRKETFFRIVDTDENLNSINSIDKLMRTVAQKFKIDMFYLYCNDDRAIQWEKLEWHYSQPKSLEIAGRTFWKPFREKIVVYTCNFGGYETVKEPLNIDPSVDYILFTDNNKIESDHWKVNCLEDKIGNPRRTSRLPKILPHKFLPKHHVSVYIDSSLEFTETNVRRMVEECIEGKDIALYRHYKRNCVYDEIEFCKNSGDRNVDARLCAYHTDKYQKINYPRNAGLFENAFIVRKNNEIVNELNEKWWEEYTAGAERDQFSLPYCLWLLGINPNAIKYGEQFRISPYVIFHQHKYIQYQ